MVEQEKKHSIQEKVVVVEEVHCCPGDPFCATFENGKLVKLSQPKFILAHHSITASHAWVAIS